MQERSLSHYKVIINDENEVSGFNEIQTTKYNWRNWLSKLMVEQFSKMANIYFLLIIILQTISSITITSSKPMNLPPLLVVVLLNAVKDLYEDYQRKKQDNEENNTKCLVFNKATGRFEENSWRSIKVGQLIKVMQDSYFPCDLLIVSSEKETGICYVETKNLDGETNLKYKAANSFLQNNYSKEHHLALLNGQINTSKPNHLIYEFNGVANIQAHGESEHTCKDYVLKSNIKADSFQIDASVSEEVMSDKVDSCRKVNKPKSRETFQSQNDFTIGDLHCDSQNKDTCKSFDKSLSKKITLNKDNLLLRGCSLKQTKFVVGIAIYVGHDSKIMKNFPIPSQKASRIEKKLQILIIIILIGQILLSIIGACISLIFVSNKQIFLNAILLKESHSSFMMFVHTVGTWVIIFTNLVPVSLLITLDMVKFFQSKFISWDVNIYDNNQKKSAVVQTSTLNEELGQINYIFSDKTGTLTKNCMKFKGMSILGVNYGSIQNYFNNNSEQTLKINQVTSEQKSIELSRESVKTSKSKKEKKVDFELFKRKTSFGLENDLIESASLAEPLMENDQKIKLERITLDKIVSSETKATDVERKPPNMLSSQSLTTVKNFGRFFDKNIEIPLVSFKDNLFWEHLNDTSHPNNKFIYEFIICLATCHSIFTESIENSQYQASSPDELALVNAAKHFGFTFQHKDIDNKIYLNICDENIVLTRLAVLDYTSDRKRMSIVLRMSDGSVMLFTKGSDDCIIPKCKKSYGTQNLHNSLAFYLENGLRTLAIASKKLSKLEEMEFLTQYDFAISGYEDTKKEKDTELAFESIEKNMNFLGITAVEDQLQDNVPETIKHIKDAGIKFWIITGDKSETAKKVSLSAGIINSKTTLFEISPDSVEQDIDAHINSINELEEKMTYKRINSHEIEVEQRFLRSKSTTNTEFVRYIDVDQYKNIAIVLGSDSISKIMKSVEFQDKFFKLSSKVNSVICSRAIPKQKAELVSLVKDRAKKTSILAIGDGANDVNMISTANVGVGIFGKEGNQAARASDFAIGEFKMLKHLLFVHGRESYRKNSYVIIFNFYKNIIFLIPQFFLGFISFFSGHPLYDSTLYLLYNLLFTSAPIFIYGILDKDINYPKLIKDVRFYHTGMRSVNFSTKWVLATMLSAFFQGVIIFCLTFFGVGDRITSKGNLNDLYFLGNLIFMVTVIISNTRLFFVSGEVTLISGLGILISTLLYFVMMIYQSSNPLLDIYGVTNQLKNTSFMIFVFIITTFCLIIDNAFGKLYWFVKTNKFEDS